MGCQGPTTDHHRRRRWVGPRPSCVGCGQGFPTASWGGRSWRRRSLRGRTAHRQTKRRDWRRQGCGWQSTGLPSCPECRRWWAISTVASSCAIWTSSPPLAVAYRISEVAKPPFARGVVRWKTTWPPSAATSQPRPVRFEFPLQLLLVTLSFRIFRACARRTRYFRWNSESHRFFVRISTSGLQRTPASQL
jgi:hypothetical protein